MCGSFEGTFYRENMVLTSLLPLIKTIPSANYYTMHIAIHVPQMATPLPHPCHAPNLRGGVTGVPPGLQGFTDSAILESENGNR